MAKIDKIHIFDVFWFLEFYPAKKAKIYVLYTFNNGQVQITCMFGGLDAYFQVKKYTKTLTLLLGFLAAKHT